MIALWLGLALATTGGEGLERFVAGDRDGSTPPDLVKETIDLIPGSQFHLIRGAGHLPCVEKPDVFAGHLMTFLKEDLHV